MITLVGGMKDEVKISILDPVMKKRGIRNRNTKEECHCAIPGTTEGLNKPSVHI
jgi:hypothetical protein